VSQRVIANAPQILLLPRYLTVRLLHRPHELLHDHDDLTAPIAVLSRLAIVNTQIALFPIRGVNIPVTAIRRCSTPRRTACGYAVSRQIDTVIALLGRVLDNAVATAGRQRAVWVAGPVSAGVVRSAKIASLSAGNNAVAANALADALRRCCERRHFELLVRKSGSLNRQNVLIRSWARDLGRERARTMSPSVRGSSGIRLGPV
jgi:hypothetical protein